jgi:hypothetical protein
MDIDFVTCPKCKCKNWNDVPKIDNIDSTVFTCNRCGHGILLGKCSKCNYEKPWKLLIGIQEKGAHRPMYRFQCTKCKRIIGLLLQPK